LCNSKSVVLKNSAFLSLSFLLAGAVAAHTRILMRTRNWHGQS
jgi:hypothetical protein